MFLPKLFTSRIVTTDNIISSHSQLQGEKKGIFIRLKTNKYSIPQVEHLQTQVYTPWFIYCYPVASSNWSFPPFFLLSIYDGDYSFRRSQQVTSFINHYYLLIAQLIMFCIIRLWKSTSTPSWNSIYTLKIRSSHQVYLYMSDYYLHKSVSHFWYDKKFVLSSVKLDIMLKQYRVKHNKSNDTSKMMRKRLMVK